MMHDMTMDMDPEHVKMHMTYKGWVLTAIGILILINYALLGWDWWLFIGVLLIILGVLKLTGQGCPTCMGMTPTKKRKR